MDTRVELQAEVDAPREAVFALVSSAAGLARWVDAAEFEARVGGAVRLRVRGAGGGGEGVAPGPPAPPRPPAPGPGTRRSGATGSRGSCVRRRGRGSGPARSRRPRRRAAVPRRLRPAASAARAPPGRGPP